MSKDNIVKLDAAMSKEPKWYRDCLMGKHVGADGKPKPQPVLENAIIALRRDPAFRDLLSYDEMECAIILHRSLAPSPPEDFKPRSLTDVDASRIQAKLQRLGLVRLSKDTTHQAIAAVAEDNRRHPLRDYLTSLVWDKVPRVKGWLHTYLGAKRTPYSEGIGTMFLVSMVARAMQPGCKCDHMLILEGEQGVGKSTCCEILAGEKYFSDSLPDLELDKEVSQHLRGRWLVEIGEMYVYGRAAVDKLKAFMSRTHERFRPTFGRQQVVEGRQCVFIGTTNSECYLRDESGARRFWPIRVKEIDTAALKADRDQLFAEAVQMFRDGVAWHPTGDFERLYIKLEQDDRYEGDEWQDDIAEYLKGKTDVTISEVAKEALGIVEKHKLGTAEQRRIGRAMQYLRWKRGPRGTGGRRRWVPTD
jgi:predicted P-loop ATPase